MKSIFLLITFLSIFAFPKANFGQAPDLGSTSGFALFTAAGAFNNGGASVITGDVGSFTNTVVGFPGPGTVVGTIYNIGDPILTSAKADVLTAFSSFGANGNVLGTPLETHNTTGFIKAGTYHTVGAAAMNGDFTLDGENNPDALFIINVSGTLTVGAGFNIKLINSASLCNVYWLIDGDFAIGAGSNFKGTVIASGALTFGAAASLLGRGLSTGGAISLSNNVVTVSGSGVNAAGSITGTAMVCQGQTGATYSVPVLTNASGYVWTLPAGAIITAGANTNAITVAYSASAASGNVIVKGKSSCGNGVASANFAVTVTPTPAAIAGAARTICLNSATTLGAVAVSGSTYSWSSVPAGFTSTSANPSVAPLVTTTYTVVETNIAALCTNSNSVIVTVSAPAAVAGVNRTICQNASTTLGAAAVSGSTYSWSSVPAGFTSTVANPTLNPLVTTTYTLVETITSTGCTNSHDVLVTVIPAPAAVAGDARVICLGSETTIGAAAVTGSTYNWSSIPAGFTSTVSNPTVSPVETTTYTVEESNLSGVCTNKNSVVVTVNSLSAVIAGDDRTICLNENTQIGTEAVLENTYSWSSVPAGFTSSISNPIVNPLVTTTYTLVEINTASGCQGSSSVTVAVNPVPNIITEPADQIACVGNAASFSVYATGAGLTYQWRKGTLALTDGGEITGATSATLTINHVKASDVASNYNVLINGLCSAFETSRNALLTVNAAPSIATTVCAGSSVSFSATATGTGITYQWRKGDVNLTDGGNISGATSATLSINPVSVSDASSNYNVLVNGACSPGATSLSTALSVNPAFSIVSGPVAQVACIGTAASFTVAATGAGLTYQWRKGEVNLTNGGNITGATSATLSITSVSATDVASNYNVVISGACTAASKSADAALALCPLTSLAGPDAGVSNTVVTIYPNPFTSSLDIKINDVSKISNYELRMYNILGEEVINTILTKDITNLKTGNLTSGIYLYEVKSNNKTIQSGKLISKK